MLQNNPSDYQSNRASMEVGAELETKEKNLKTKQGYLKSHIISFFLPPLGFIFFIKYLFFADGTVEDFKAGAFSLLLTVLSIVISVLTIGAVFKQSMFLPAENTKILRELITPANMQKYKELYQ